MDHLEVGRYWDQNARAWTRLSRAGNDGCRDLLDTPAFLEAAAEPSADESTARDHPEIADSQIVPLFLQLRCRKPQPT